MALKKTVRMQNGIATEYHRIAMLKIDINQEITILINSYLSEDGRQVEKDYAEGKYKDVDEGLIPFPYYNAEYGGRLRYGFRTSPYHRAWKRRGFILRDQLCSMQ